MSTASPLLSVCVPTYNNAENLSHVLDHARRLPREDVEFVIVDDGSRNSPKEVIDTSDDRVTYTENDENVGFDKNLLKTIDCAAGEYVLPLSDEDKLLTDTIVWALESVTEHPSTTAVIGDFGWEHSWSGESWQEAVPEVHRASPGRESLLSFIEYPHPFADHTWRRNYIGGFMLSRDTLDIDTAREYIGSAYIHNVLMIQAMQQGETIFTSHQLCDSHYFKYDGENRFWRGQQWGDLEYRTGLQKYRLKLIDEMLTDRVVVKSFINKEIQYAAHLAAWALYSTDFDFESVYETAMDTAVRPLTDIWTSAEFQYLLRRYMFFLLVPHGLRDEGLQGELLPVKARRVWFHILKRAMPGESHMAIKRLYWKATRKFET